MTTIDSGVNKILLIGIPLEYQSGMTTDLVSENYTLVFSDSKEEAIKIIQAGELSAVIITSDLVFDDDVNQDIVALTYGKIPTLTIVLEETFEKLGQGKIWEKVYNPDALQEFCTAPFSMEELIPRLRKIIKKATKASQQ